MFNILISSSSTSVVTTSPPSPPPPPPPPRSKVAPPDSSSTWLVLAPGGGVVTIRPPSEGVSAGSSRLTSTVMSISNVFSQTATLASLNSVVDATAASIGLGVAASDATAAFVAAAFDQESFRAYLPPDVLIRCTDGTVEAHRFVLVFQCEFFQSRFRYDTCRQTRKRKRSIPATVVDLSNFHLATVETMKTLLQMLYKGQASVQFMRLDAVFNLLYLSNFLLLPRITDFCVHLLEGQLAKQDSAFVMHCYHVAEELCEKTLGALALKHIMLLEREPKNLEAVSFETMQFFLTSPESFNFQNFKSVCRMPALQREKFLLDLTLRFIKYDRSRRIRRAADLFSKLKLPFIVQHLDFDKLGLPELKKDAALKKMITQAKITAATENLWQSGIPLSLWLPRPSSVKYSFYTKRFGRFKYRRPNKSTEPAPFKTRQINLQRDQEHRITGITVYSSTWKGNHIIGGIKLKWSDGTEDHAGHYSRDSKDKVSLRTYEAVLVKVSAGDFIHQLVFSSCKRNVVLPGQQNVINVPPRSYGPFGKGVPAPGTADSGRHRSSYETALGSFRGYDEICYLDGLKCCEVSDDDGEKFITSVKFKMSFMTNLPVEHLTPRKVEGGDLALPSWGVSYLETSKVLPCTELKRAIRAAALSGYDKMGVVAIVPAT